MARVPSNRGNGYPIGFRIASCLSSLVNLAHLADVLTSSVMEMYSLHRPLPSEMAVKEALDAYLTENGSSCNYDAAKVDINFLGIRVQLPNPTSRKVAGRFHYLHHLVTGYGTDPTGESEVSAWEIRRGISVFSPYIWVLFFSVLLGGLFHSPKSVFRAWRVSKVGNPLPEPSIEHYESCLDLSLGELREAYGVPQEGMAGHGNLHLDAPPKSGKP